MSWIARKLLETSLRIEAKLDELLCRSLKNNQQMVRPMAWKGAACPMCQKPVEYIQIRTGSEGDVLDVYRKCGCAPSEVRGPVYPGEQP